MSDLLQDLRYGFRTLLKSPGFLGVAVLTLALGIGLNTTVFSLVDALLFRPLPYAEPERLVHLYERHPQTHPRSDVFSFVDLQDIGQQSQSFEHVAAYVEEGLNLSGGAEPQRVSGARASASVFPLLGVPPLLGRGFGPEEDRPGAAPVVVLGHDLWRQRYGADPGILGKRLRLDGQEHAVIGVMPPKFKFFEMANLWVPLARDPVQADRADRSLSAVARLRPGVSLEAAQEELEALGQRLEQAYPATNRGWRLSLERMQTGAGPGAAPLLLTMLGAVGCVLLIACANVTNLLLARAAARSQEIAIRTAIGASRGRVLRQLLTESLILAVLGGAGGLLLSMWGIDLVSRNLLPGEVPGWFDLSIDHRVLGFTLLVSVATGVITSLAPARISGRLDCYAVLKGTGLAAPSSARRLRGRLVVGQIAAALILLISAGLLMQSLLRHGEVDLGYDTKNLLQADLPLPAAKYRDAGQQRAFAAGVLERIRLVPGVRHAAFSANLPIRFEGDSGPLLIDGAPGATAGPATWRNSYEAISPEWPQTAGLPLLQGRLFTAGDPQGLALVSKTFAEQNWPGASPLGRSLRLQGLDTQPRSLTVVGVLGDTYFPGDNEPIPTLYLPLAEAPQRWLHLLVRVDSDPALAIPAVRQQLLAADPDQAVQGLQTTDAYLALRLVPIHFLLTLFAVFAGMALAMAALGIYGVVAYGVSQRTREIGIRMALGAQRQDTLRLVAGEGLSLLLKGLGLGLLGAFAATRLLSSMLYGVTSTDPLTYCGISLLLAVVVLAASVLPARKALSIVPTEALRHD